jgi:hypothetical protein
LHFIEIHVGSCHFFLPKAMMTPMSYQFFSGVREVAVMPSDAAPPNQVLEIATVLHAGPVFVQLQDGRMFATIGGAGLNTSGCIVLATSEHRTALEARKHKAG